MLDLLGGERGFHGEGGVVVDIGLKGGKAVLQIVHTCLDRFLNLGEGGSGGGFILHGKYGFLNKLTGGAGILGSGACRGGRCQQCSCDVG